MPRKKKRFIYMVSDGTCRTCEHVLRAVLVQFEDDDISLVKKANVRRKETVAKVIKEAAKRKAVVFYTLVTKETRDAIASAARESLVPVVDLLGPVMASLYDLYQLEPRATPGILYDSHRGYFDRIDAVEYTLHHDDGCRCHELKDADVILVGVSRASKSTTCFYLAYRGIRAANVPVVPDSDLPQELFSVDPRRVIGLIKNPHRLQSVRESRLRSWGSDITADYADRIKIARELRAANEMFQKNGWRVLDVSYKAIEEIAHEVLQKLEEAGVQIGGRRPMQAEEDPNISRRPLSGK